MFRHALPGLALAASRAALPAASLERLGCSGVAPAWTLTLDGDAARFAMPESGRPVTRMQVMQRSAAEGRDWPRAMTLIGKTDTAILLLEREPCGAAPVRAHVLTQQGQRPILLTGCCVAAS